MRFEIEQIDGGWCVASGGRALVMCDSQNDALKEVALRLGALDFRDARASLCLSYRRPAGPASERLGLAAAGDTVRLQAPLETANAPPAAAAVEAGAVVLSLPVRWTAANLMAGPPSGRFGAVFRTRHRRLLLPDRLLAAFAPACQPTGCPAPADRDGGENGTACGQPANVGPAPPVHGGMLLVDWLIEAVAQWLSF